MSEETTQTPLYAEIFQAFEAGVPAENNRRHMQANCFPLANLRAFPLVIAAYLDPESEETGKAIENPTQGLDNADIGDFVTGLIVTNTMTQVNVTNISGVVPTYAHVSNRFEGKALDDAQVEELTTYLFGLMRTIPTVRSVEDLAYVSVIDGEEESLSKAEAQDVRDLITSLITSPRFTMAFTNDSQLSFAMWEDEESDEPVLSGRILFTAAEVAEKIVSGDFAEGEEGNEE